MKEGGKKKRLRVRLAANTPTSLHPVPGSQKQLGDFEIEEEIKESHRVDAEYSTVKLKE